MELFFTISTVLAVVSVGGIALILLAVAMGKI